MEKRTHTFKVVEVETGIFRYEYPNGKLSYQPFESNEAARLAGQAMYELLDHKTLETTFGMRPKVNPEHLRIVEQYPQRVYWSSVHGKMIAVEGPYLG